MKSFEREIKYYLSKSTSYAMQVNGKFGNGKTHYYLISTVPVVSMENKKYKPVYISLFGLKSIEDVEMKIVMSFYETLLFKNYFKQKSRRRVVKVSKGVFKIALRGFLTLKSWTDAYEFVPDLKETAKDTLNTDELVICFDDLERKHSSLDLNDLISYINNLIDEGVKVIIIANEDVLLAGGEVYKSLKEKIIGLPITYKPDVDSVMESIIKTHYSGSPAYSAFLREHKKVLRLFAASVENNFRHVIYATDRLQDIYSVLRNEILDPDVEIAPAVTDKLDDILIFILAIATEYRVSGVQQSDIKEYEARPSTIQELFERNGQVANVAGKKKKYESLMDKYHIENGHYQLYPSVFNTITGQEDFDGAQFVQEFTSIFKLEKGQKLPQYQLLEELSHGHFEILSDREYEEKTSQMLVYAKKGMYALPEYLTVLYYCQRLSDVFEMDMIQVFEWIKEGFNKALVASPPDGSPDFVQFEFNGSVDGLSNMTQDFYTYGMTNIRNYKERWKREQFDIKLALLVNEPKRFFEQYGDDAKFRKEVDDAVLVKYADIDRLSMAVSSSDSKTIENFRLFFKQTVNSNTKDEAFILVKLRSLAKNLTAHLTTLPGDGEKIRRHFLQSLVKELSLLTGNDGQSIEA